MKVGKLNGKELIPLKGDRNETCDFNISVKKWQLDLNSMLLQASLNSKRLGHLPSFFLSSGQHSELLSTAFTSFIMFNFLEILH